MESKGQKPKAKANYEALQQKKMEQLDIRYSFRYFLLSGIALLAIGISNIKGDAVHIWVNFGAAATIAIGLYHLIFAKKIRFREKGTV